MEETSIMAGISTSPSPFPYPIEKIGDFPSKWGRARVIPTRTSLFAISSYK